MGVLIVTQMLSFNDSLAKLGERFDYAGTQDASQSALPKVRLTVDLKEQHYVLPSVCSRLDCQPYLG